VVLAVNSKRHNMKTIFKLFIVLVVLGTIIAIMTYKEFDVKPYLRWELFVIMIPGISVWLFFLWRKMMRLEETTVSIQLLDD